MFVGTSFANMNKKFQKEVFKMVKQKFKRVILFGCLSVNLSHLKREDDDTYNTLDILSCVKYHMVTDMDMSFTNITICTSTFIYK